MREDRRPTLSFLRLRPETDADIPLPRYMTSQASGMDIHAAVASPLTIDVQAIALVPTGFAMALPEGFEAQIRPRSGLAVKYGIGLINSPGTIDADYRGEVKIALINLGEREFTVQRADRIAQMVIQRVCRLQVAVVEDLEPTLRDHGGFGHTGVKG
jgi:dUTP pyrophosphatase